MAPPGRACEDPRFLVEHALPVSGRMGAVHLDSRLRQRGVQAIRQILSFLGGEYQIMLGHGAPRSSMRGSALPRGARAPGKRAYGCGAPRLASPTTRSSGDSPDTLFPRR